MALVRETLVKEDLDLGYGAVAKTADAGGSLTGHKIGLHTFHGSFTMMDLGATGDGTTDDAADEQEMIDLVSPLRSRAIFVPSPNSVSGTYRTNTKLKIQSAVSLKGENREGTIFQTSSNSITPLELKNITAPLTGSPYGIFLEDLYFLGPDGPIAINSSVPGLISESIHTSGFTNISSKGFDVGIQFKPGTDTTAQANNDVYMLGCWIEGNKTVNIDAQKRTDHLAVISCRIGDSLIGIKHIDGSELHVAFSGFYDHDTCDIDIDEVATPGFALQSNAMIFANHFEYSAASAGNIRVGNTQTINGFNCIGNTFGSAAGVTPISLIRAVSPVIIGNVAYQNATKIWDITTVTNLVALGNTVNVIGGGVHGAGTPLNNFIQGETHFGGVADPSGSLHKFSFTDSGNLGTVRIDARNATQTNSALLLNVVRAANVAFDFADFYSGDLGSLRFMVDGVGDVKNVNNAYGAISDRKLKRDEKPAGSQMTDVRALAGLLKKYRLKDNPDGPFQLGWVAQDIEALCPGLVSETEDRVAVSEEQVTPERVVKVRRRDGSLEDMVIPERRETVTDMKPNGQKTKSVKYSIAHLKLFGAFGEAMETIDSILKRLSDVEAKLS